MNARDRRALLIGGAVVAAALLGLRAVPAGIRAYRELVVSARERMATVSRAHAVIENRDAVADSLQAAAETLVTLAPKLVPGRGAQAASAELPALVAAAAHRSGMEVVRVTGQADSAGGLFRRARAHAELEGRTASLARLLAELERGEIVLSVPDLRVTAEGYGGAREVLRVSLTVEGWYLALEPSP